MLPSDQVAPSLLLLSFLRFQNQTTEPLYFSPTGRNATHYM
jgi:hypothetical protein